MTCKYDCIHYEACVSILKEVGYDASKGDGKNADKRCDVFADKSRFIKLPCKIGDTVYRVCKKKYDIDGYGMQWEEDWGIVTNSFHLGMFHEIGITVFLTKEEAETALAERIGK